MLHILTSEKSFNENQTKVNSHLVIVILFQLFTLLVATGLPTPAQALQKAQGEFFLINESPATQNSTAQFSSPQNMVAQSLNQGLGSQALNLLNWTFFKQNRAVSYEDYDRLKHFGTWINEPHDNDCQNTRTKVLVRDSVTKVTFKDGKKCSVEHGTWKDPYTRRVYYSSSDIQIDHLVPLKHAYQTGAWKWNFYTRCLYANYMGNSIHLLSVQGQANMSKSDKSPDQWLPPNESYRCEYLRNWLIVKLIWRLELTANESNGIKKALIKYKCPLNVYAMSTKDFQQQRNLIQTSAQQCAHLKPR